MSFDDNVFNYLTRNPGIAGLVGDRTYPGSLPQRPTLPALTYQELSSTNPYRTQMDEGPVQSRYRISCWATTLEAANDLAAAVCGAIRGHAGPGLTNLRDGGAAEQDPETRLWRRRLEFIMTHED